MFLTCKSQLLAFSLGSPLYVGRGTEIFGAGGAVGVVVGVIAVRASVKAVMKVLNCVWSILARFY